MWNYRIMRRDPNGYCGGETIHIVEVYYDEIDGEQTIAGWSALPVYPQGETLGEFVKDLTSYKDAILKPVLDESELEKECGNV